MAAANAETLCRRFNGGPGSPSPSEWTQVWCTPARRRVSSSVFPIYNVTFAKY